MISKQKLFNRMGYAGQLGRLGDILYGLKNGLDGKVSAEDGKVLSSNDFTDEYKQKLEEISTRNAVTASAVVSLTREEYLALESHDENTLYFVTDGLGEGKAEMLLGNQEIKLYCIEE